MKKLFYFLALILSIGLVSCSDDKDEILVKPDEPTTPVTPNQPETDEPNDDIIADSEPSATVFADGFYIANEDWFGWDNGTVNFFKNDGSINYRAYRAANPGEQFGVTTQFATIYGGKAFFMSKQGDRLVVADAKTLKKQAVFTNINGDGRAFLGIDPNKAYLGTANGVTLFDIKNMRVGSTISGISGQTGNMCLLGNHAFVVVSGKGVYAIDTDSDQAELILSGSFGCMTQSRNGKLWVSASAGPVSKLIEIDPYTFEQTDHPIPVAVPNSWGAWNAGSLSASTQQDVLYWSNGKKIVKYDIESKTADKDFYTLGVDEEGEALAFYGAALRVDPISDKLIVTVKRSGWGASGSYNWVHILNKDGKQEKVIEVLGDNGSGSGWGTGAGRYFWFPAMPFFQDVNAPEILMNQIIMKPTERVAINLSDKIVDADNMSTAIVKSIDFDKSDDMVKYQLKQDSLIVVSTEVKGMTTFTLKANSNGVVVEKKVRVDVR